MTGVVLFVTVPAAAQDTWGIIAFGLTGENARVAYGFSWNYPARDAAHAAANDACVPGGGTDCVQLAGFRNGCGALAMDDHGSAQGKSAMSREQAEARALRTCETAEGKQLHDHRFHMRRSGRRSAHIIRR